METHPETSCLTVPNNLSYLTAILAYAEGVAGIVGFRESETRLILLALEEAVANVIEHAFEPDEKASYQVIFEPLSSGLKIIVKDKGLPFAPGLVPGYTTPADIDDVGAGLGSFLMKKSVDEYSLPQPWKGRQGTASYKKPS
jgi:anti-sigma regulatory factor (Ser/Thr protein kinase)